MRGEESSCAVTPPPPNSNYSPSHLTISDKGTSIHVCVADSIAPKWAYKRAPFLQNPKIHYFRRDARANFGFLDLWIYGVLELWILIENSKNPRVQKSKIGYGISAWILDFWICDEFCFLWLRMLPTRLRLRTGVGIRFFGLVRITRELWFMQDFVQYVLHKII